MHFLSSNNGTHSPHNWAALTAEFLFNTNELDGDKQLAAQRLQLDATEVLLKHYAAFIEQLKAGFNDQVMDVDFTQVVEDMITEIVGVVSRSPWAAQWQNPEVVQAARDILNNHTSTILDVERRWYLDHTENNS